MPGKTRFRFMALAILAVLAVTLAALPGVSADGGGGKAAPIPQSDGTGGGNQAPLIPDKAELNYPNLGSRLDQLVASVETGQATVHDAASTSSLHSGESVAVTIYLDGNVDAVVSYLEDNGGDPRNVGEDYIEAYVPVTLLGAVSEQPGVIRVREIVPPEPAQANQGVAGHGPAAHLSAPWNQAGYSGQGIKVGIIDSVAGFKGFNALMGTELPSNGRGQVLHGGRQVLPSTWRTAKISENFGSVHGTAVAEAVIDIAPEVTLYHGQPAFPGRLEKCRRLDGRRGCIGHRPLGKLRRFDGPGDGTSPSSISPR